VNDFPLRNRSAFRRAKIRRCLKREETLRSKIWTAVKYGLLSAVFVFVTRYVFTQWQSIHEVKHLKLGGLAWAFVGGMMAPLLNVRSCQRLLAAHGVSLRYRQVVGLFYIPMLGKYVPGKVWSLMTAFAVYGREGISKKVTAVNLTVLMALAMISSLLVIVVFGHLSPLWSFNYWLCVISSVVLIAGMYPPLFYGILNAVLSLLGRSAINPIPSFLEIIEISLMLVLARSVYGVGFFFVVSSVSDVPLSELPGMVAVFTFAQVAGLVAVFTPAGIGVREGALLLGLEPVVGPGPAIVATAICRLWQTLIELIMAIAGWVGLRFTDSASGTEENDFEERTQCVECREHNEAA